MTRKALALAAACALAGCGDDDFAPASDLANADLAGDLSGADQSAAPSDLAPPSLAAKVRANPAMVVGAFVDVTTTAGSIVVQWGPTGLYGQTTPAIPVPASGTVSVPIFGLEPSATSHFRVLALGAAPAASGDLPLSTGPLPANFPTWTIATDDGTADGYVLLSFVSSASAVIIDRRGHLMWYYAPAGSNGVIDFQQQANGDRTVYVIGTPPRYDQLDRTGRVLRAWSDPFAPLDADGHDFLLLPNSHGLLLGRAVNPYDTSAVIDGGTAAQPLIDTTVDEINPDGGSAFHWSSFGQIGPDETTPDIDLRAADADAQHVNALALALDGNILISMRHTDTVYKIDRSTGAILWRLGGARSDFTFVDDPLNGFSHQHFARQLPSGDLLLLDNGNLHSPPVSRAVEYRLDEQAMTARLVWQARRAPAVFTQCCGSAERQANGNTLVDWAATAGGAIVDEFDPFAAVHWELTSPILIYRALRIPSL
ncbi:MAG TPA: aryl-sulfate sulfotransferase [Polyangia bacterium]|nr:aryl-sulfate sulfotransferase [Polyangia bacterium]